MFKGMKKLKSFGLRYGATIALYVVVGITLLILYVYGSRRFLPGLSSAEIEMVKDSSSLSNIINNPLWLPYKLIGLLFHSLKFSAETYRFISAGMVMAAVYAFNSLCRIWYRPRVAALTTALFALSSTTLTLARVATPAVLLYTWLFLAAAVLWFRQTRRVRLAPVGVLVLLAFALYIPGAVWFMVLLAIWFWRDVPRYFKDMKRWAIGAGALGAILVCAPLVYAFVHDGHLLTAWLLLPSAYDLNTSLTALRDIPAAFFYRSTPASSAYGLGSLPLLDAFSGTMLLIGLYAYRKSLKLERTVIYSCAAIVSIVLTTLSANQLYLFMLLPFTYLLAGNGMAYLMEEWRGVFPRNPLARIVGTTILSIAVLSACLYHMNRFYVAWQNNPSVKQIYSQHYKP